MRIARQNITFAPLLQKAFIFTRQKSIENQLISNNFSATIMNTLSYRTVSVSAEMADRKWYVIDAENQVVGRLCAKVAAILRGKTKPSYTPHADTGDYVIVINADKVRFTGKKWMQKEYKDHSLYPGGLRLTTAEAMLEKDSRRIIERGVKGMLPKNTLGRQMQRKLFVYSGDTHPHAAQKPEVLSLQNTKL